MEEVIKVPPPTKDENCECGECNECILKHVDFYEKLEQK